MAKFEEVKKAQEQFLEDKRFRKYASGIGTNDGGKTFFLVVYLEKPLNKRQRKKFPSTYTGVSVVIEVIGEIDLQ